METKIAETEIEKTWDAFLKEIQCSASEVKDWDLDILKEAIAGSSFKDKSVVVRGHIVASWKRLQGIFQHFQSISCLIASHHNSSSSHALQSLLLNSSFVLVLKFGFLKSF